MSDEGPSREELPDSEEALSLLRKRVDELKVLHETALSLTSLRDVSTLLSEMVEQLRHVLEVEIVSIMLLDEDEGTLRIAAAAGLPSDIVASARVKLGEGISGQTAAEGEPVLIKDMSKHPGLGRSAYHSQYTTESLICVPLKIGNKVLGVINVNNKPSGQALVAQDLALVTTFSAQAALALENSRLYSNLEAEVARMQEFNESILRNMGSGLVTLDLSGRVTKVNRAAEEMLGVPSPLPRDESLATLFGEAESEIVLGKGSGAGQGSARREVVARSRHGRELLVGYSVTPQLDARGQEIGVIVLFRDLTELKKMEEELVRMDRMASLGILGAGLAHEIRNPLAAIRFNLAFLSEGGVARPELDVIVKNVERLDDLVKKLLRFARPQPPSMRPRSLGKRVAAVASLIAKQARSEGIDVLCELDEDLPLVRIDGGQVEQVVLNIALNGMQVMRDGGRLILRTRRAPAPPGTQPSHVEVLISDDGPGLSAEQVREIFDPFFTTREGGTGLGLAVALRIVQDHGGYIEISPEAVGDERGATFIVGFALAEGESADGPNQA